MTVHLECLERHIISIINATKFEQLKFDNDWAKHVDSTFDQHLESCQNQNHEVSLVFYLVKNSFQLVSVIECPFRIMAVPSTIMSRYYFGTKSAAHFHSNFEHIMNVCHVAAA